MKIQVSVNSTDYKQAQYNLGTSRKKYAYQQAMGQLIADHICDSTEAAEKLLSEAWLDHQSESRSSEDQEREHAAAVRGLLKLTKAAPSLDRRLSQDAVDLLSQYMGWFADSNGNFQWFYRLANEGRVWDVCSNPIPAMMDRNQGRYLDFQSKWFKLHSQEKIKAWVVFDEDEGISPLLDNNQLLKICMSLLPEEDRISMPAQSERWFLKWADKDFDPKQAPYSDQPEIPVDMLPKLRQLFDPNSQQAWVANLMKEDPQNLSIKMPETITNDPEVDAFTYVNIKGLSDGPTPAWDKWIQSVHPVCREIFMAAVFAPMHEKCRHRKLVWMRSQGYDGKSTFFNALNRWSGGKLTKSFGKHEITSDFGMEGLIGARILLWGDSQHDNALSTNVVHNITGGDLVTINRKNEKAIQYRFNSMMFVASNTRPQLKTWARNETTRLLYIPFQEPKDEILKDFTLTDENGKVLRQSDGTPMFKGSNLEDELVAEMPHILYKCAVQYKKYCPEPYRDLAIPEAVYDLMLEEAESEDGNEFAVFVAKNLAFDPKFEVGTKEIHDLLKRKLSGKVSNYTINEFFRYVEKNYGVQKRRSGVKGSQTTKYFGMKLKGSEDPELVI